MAPGFPVNGSKVKIAYAIILWTSDILTGLILSFQITIIDEPQIFYNTLLEKCRNAKKRITLASLYLGTGALEAELVSISATHKQKSYIQILLLNNCKG